MSIATKRFASGNEAVIDAALAAGCHFFAGYPVTPATAEEARYELSWLTDDDEPARSISSPGEQLTFGLA